MTPRRWRITLWAAHHAYALGIIAGSGQRGTGSGYDELNCMCDDEDFMDLLDCTHCGGDGICDDGADPLWSCPAEAHFCHACNGSGKRRDQVIF